MTRQEPVWIWGRHTVLEGLRAGSVLSVLMAADRKQAHVLDEITNLAARLKVPVRQAPGLEIERVAPGQNTQGVAAQIRAPRAVDLRSLLKDVTKGSRNAFLLALDQIQDPQNLGSLLRTAYAAGVDGVIAPERGSAPRSGVVAKVSAGAVSHVPMVDVVNLSRALDEIRAAGIWVVGLEGTAKTTLYELDLTMPTTLVVGAEGTGLRRLTRERCDLLARLPMPGPMESLNAAVAGAIAMFEVVRQRASAAQ